MPGGKPSEELTFRLFFPQVCSTRKRTILPAANKFCFSKCSQPHLHDAESYRRVISLHNLRADLDHTKKCLINWSGGVCVWGYEEEAFTFLFGLKISSGEKNCIRKKAQKGLVDPWQSGQIAIVFFCFLWVIE